jgi:8-amino-7-oxononanoate synthase
MTLDENAMFEEKLDQIKKAGLYRVMKDLQTPQGPWVRIAGRDLLMLSSNSYLGLCSDDRLKKAAAEAARRYGVGAGGSRLISGNYVIHRQLEEDIAAFKNAQAALIFNTGYMANLGVISAVADRTWTIFSDRFNHASIIDGCRLSGAKVVV